MTTFEKTLLVKVMIAQLVVCQILPIKKYYKLIAINLSNQQKLDADTKTIQQINFTQNLDRDDNTRIFCVIEEARKKTVLDFSKGTVKVL